MKRLRHSGKQAGNAMLEFALAASLLAVIFVGIYQFGYAFYVYNKLHLNVYNAAMFSSMTVYDASDPARFSDTIRNLVLYGTVDAGAKPIVPGLAAANIDITLNPVAGLPTVVTVQIRNFRIDSVFAKHLLRDKPRVTTLFIGQVTCSACQ
jgi:hypothetical protein